MYYIFLEEDVIAILVPIFSGKLFHLEQGWGHELISTDMIFLCDFQHHGMRHLFEPLKRRSYESYINQYLIYYRHIGTYYLIYYQLVFQLFKIIFLLELLSTFSQTFKKKLISQNVIGLFRNTPLLLCFSLISPKQCNEYY